MFKTKRAEQIIIKLHEQTVSQDKLNVAQTNLCSSLMSTQTILWKNTESNKVWHGQVHKLCPPAPLEKKTERMHCKEQRAKTIQANWLRYWFWH
jgi:hypothetical protein